MIINQNDHIYYSSVNTVRWTDFSVPVTSFSTDKEHNEIDLNSIDGKHFVVNSKLKLIRSYIDSTFFNKDIPKDNIFIDLVPFLHEGVKSVVLTSAKWIPAKSAGRLQLLDSVIQKQEFILKKDSYYYSKSKKNAFSGDMLKKILTDELHFSFENIKSGLQFTASDYNDYKNYHIKKNIGLQKR